MLRLFVIHLTQSKVMHLSEFGIELNEILNPRFPGTTTTGQTVRSDVQVENDTAPMMTSGFLIKAHIQVHDFRATARVQMRNKWLIFSL